ncbi:MAG: hypothetical protein ACE5NP_08305, partial [Anaerolineae bacterium]
PEPRFNLAACLLAIGERERAFAENQKAIEATASSTRLAVAIEDLNRLKEVQPDTPGLEEMLEQLRQAQEKLKK